MTSPNNQNDGFTELKVRLSDLHLDVTEIRRILQNLDNPEKGLIGRVLLVEAEVKDLRAWHHRMLGGILAAIGSAATAICTVIWDALRGGKL